METPVDEQNPSRPVKAKVHPSRLDKMIMDPDCAICSQPALAQCDCEAKGLDVAVRQAEQRMMETHFSAIRYLTVSIPFLSIYLTLSDSSWVRGHAQDYILSYYEVLTTRRKQAHDQHVNALTAHCARVFHTHPHPAELARANSELKRGIDEDWRASVQRYPEVLEYFYSLVEMSLPSEDDVAVRDPPLSALSGARKQRQRDRATIEESRARGRETPSSSRRPGRMPWASQGTGSGYAYAGPAY
jgi:hypothetical protein